MVNTNTYNIWIRQPLLAADIIEAKHCPWDYQTIMSHEGDDVKVSFCPVPTPEIQAEIMAASVVENSKTKKAKATSKNPKIRNKARGPSSVLDPSLIVLISILKENWRDFHFL